MKRYPVVSALLLCGASGALFSILRLPLPWMIGPLLAMACGKFVGFTLVAPKGGRAAGQVVIGCALGLYFSPVVALEVVAHWYLLVAAALFAVLLAYASGWFLSRSAGLDSTTALFASVPGGAAEMTILGERFGAQSDRVVLAQSLRILLVVVIVPFTIAAVGAHGADAYEPPLRDVSVQWLIVLLAIAVAAGGLLKGLNMPNAWMLGPLAATIALTVTEVHFSAMPVALSNTAQVLIGCALGSGFQRDSLRTAPRFMIMVCITIVIAIVFSALFGWGVALAGAVPTPTMVLATAPGGMAEMCITAKVLQLGVPLVTAAHVTRVIILVTTTGPLFRLARHMRRKLRR